MGTAKGLVADLLKDSGCELDGKRPWDLSVRDERFYSRLVGDGTLGLGESYVDGWWESEQLDELLCRVIREGGTNKVKRTLANMVLYVQSRLLNMQTKTRAKSAAVAGYDHGNELYMAFLDPYMQYTCGYFKDTDDLAVAQEQKLDLICRKLQITPKDRVLDIGCGWGGFTRYAASHYGCHVTGINVSNAQVDYAQAHAGGLPITIKKMDYRDLSGEFDKVLVCGMIEHVGYKNYRTLFEIVKKVLKPTGLFLLHTIGGNESSKNVEPWIHKYIFPNTMMPSIAQIGTAIENLFVMEDWHNFGAYYDRTLQAWWRKFNEAWPRFREQYGERFWRMFRYYMLACAGGFRARDMQLWQIVLSPLGVPGGYTSVR